MIVEKYHVKIAGGENDGILVVAPSQLDQSFTERFWFIAAVRNRVNTFEESRSHAGSIRVPRKAVYRHSTITEVARYADARIVRVHHEDRRQSAAAFQLRFSHGTALSLWNTHS